MLRTNPYECELIGAIIGDGHIHIIPKRNYVVGFTGHPITDKLYYEILRKHVYRAWNYNVKKTMVRGGALRMAIYSKKITKRLTAGFGLAHNYGKCYRVTIPEQIEEDWELARHTIRGIVDTDGSIFVANKPRCPNYPSIEISTTSIKLAKQLRCILKNNGFKPAHIWQSKSKISSHVAYRVPLNGRENLKKWVNAIGFTNPYKLQRATSALNGSVA